jgi:hypothetical protein
VLRLNRPGATPVAVWVIWLTLVLANSASVFAYRFTSVLALLVVLAALLSVLSLSSGASATAPRAMVLLVLWVAAVAGLTTPALLYVPGPARLVLAFSGLCAVALATALTVRAPRYRIVLVVSIVAIAATGVVLLLGEAEPRFDVWYFSQQAASDLAHGRYFYGHAWVYPEGIPTDRWIPRGFPYGPATVLLLLPGYVLGDVRIAVLAFGAFGAFLLWKADRAFTGSMTALALAVTPAGYALVRSSWTEPLLFVELCALFMALRAGRGNWAIAALALGLATKQHLLVLLPLFAIHPAMGPRRTIHAILGASVVVAPWFFVNPGAFIDDTLFLHVDQPMRADGKDIAALGLRLHWSPPGWLLLSFLAVVAIFVCLTVLRRQDLGSLAVGCAAMLLAANLVNKQAFFNQYWLVSSLLLLGLALWSGQAERSDDPPHRHITPKWAGRAGRGEP